MPYHHSDRIEADIHDHHIRELRVNAPERTITMVTAFPGNAGAPTEVRFDGVGAYVFSGDALGTILFEVEQVDPFQLYKRYAEFLQRAYRANGGHAPWCESEEAAGNYLRGLPQVRGYEIGSSIGMCGAVWAAQLTVRSLDA